jgi:hypothetical protein
MCLCIAILSEKKIDGNGQVVDVDPSNTNENVVIQHFSNYVPSSLESAYMFILQAGILCDGNNRIAHLKVLNQTWTGVQYLNGGWVQNSVEFSGYGELISCRVDSRHIGVIGSQEMIIRDCTQIRSCYLYSINAKGPFEISNCTINPLCGSSNIEHPCGIKAESSGIISGVYIDGACPQESGDGTGISGIDCILDEHEAVVVKNSHISLTASSTYYSNDPAYRSIYVRGISCTGGNVCIYGNSQISVTGNESTGAGIQVDGIYLAGGARCSLKGTTSITTNRTLGVHAEYGHQYLLYGEGNSTYSIDFGTVTFNPNGPNPPASYSTDYVYLEQGSYINSGNRVHNQNLSTDYFTIQAAITAANSGNTLILTPGIYFELVQTQGKNLTLQSQNPQDPATVEDTIVHGYMNGTPLTISGTDSIQGITITGGSATNGGGISISSGSPTISNCIIRDNVATSSGGGLYSAGTSPTVTNCEFSSNSAGSGGGVNIPSGTVTIHGCTFSGNHATSGAGGGIYGAIGIQSTIEDCKFNDNIANMSGGAVYNYKCVSILRNCLFQGNSSALFGGGVVNWYCHPAWNASSTIWNCTFTGNSSGSTGGALYNAFSNLNMTNSILWGNQATNSPELYNTGTGVVTVNYCDIYGGWSGGTGNFNQNPGLLTDGYHLSTTSPCINGGDPAYVPVTGETDIDGEARIVHGFVDMGADETVYLGTFYVSTSGNDNNNGSVNSPFRTIQCGINHAANADTVVIEPGTFTGSGNRDLDFGGKTITVKGTNPNIWSIVEATIIDCQGSAQSPHRGFIFQNDVGCAAKIEGITIQNGYGDLQYWEGYQYPMGGAIFCTKNGTIGSNPTISRCRILNCQADKDNTGLGGGIAAVNSQPMILNCFILQNEAYAGGGIFISNGPAQIKGCVIRWNTGYDGAGVTLYGNPNDPSANTPILNNCTIVDNGDWWTTNAGGIEIDYSTPTLKDCIIWGNESYIGDQIGICVSTPGITYCDVEGGWTGTGNINQNPAFTSDGYHLSSASPCIDADPVTGFIPGLPTDIDGDLRKIDGNGDSIARIDMGADEYKP